MEPMEKVANLMARDAEGPGVTQPQRPRGTPVTFAESGGRALTAPGATHPGEVERARDAGRRLCRTPGVDEAGLAELAAAQPAGAGRIVEGMGVAAGHHLSYRQKGVVR